MVSTISNAGWPALSIALRISATGERQPVDVSLCRKQTALISLLLVFAQARFDRGRIGADAPVGGDEFGHEAELLGHLLPQRGELAGFHHQHLVAGRQRVDERGFPGAGSGRGVDDHRIGGLEDRLDAVQALLGELANSGPRWSMIGVSIARKMRSGSGEGPGMCRKWRPTVREEFLAIGSPLLKRQLFRDFVAWPRARSRLGAALVALNYECNIAVKRFSARPTSPYA